MRKTFTRIILSLCTILSLPLLSAQTTVTLPAAKDNSMHSENDNSNAKGSFLFTGQTEAMNNGALRRALIQFDLSEIPSDATVTSAELRITGSKQSSDNVSIHRLTADWGEGTSEATGQQGQGASPTSEDATWNFSFFEMTSWETPGGDFVAEPSATAAVQNQQQSVWTGEGVVADIQAWLSGNAENFGWIIVGDETANGTAVRLVSRESDMAAPELEITYEMTTNSNDLLAGVANVSIYPSIAQDQLTVETTTTTGLDGVIRVMDLLGRQHIERDVQYAAQGNYQEVIDISSLVVGTYLVRIENGQRSLSRKIIKE